MRKYLIFLAGSGACLSSAQAQDVSFKPLVDARLRYEAVEQDGPAPLNRDRDAHALTLRLRTGAQISSGPLAFLAEAEATLALDGRYNSGVNGRPLYPVIPDPENVELNRLQMEYRTPVLGMTVGRQRINLDDQRFVGSVAWRQNEQTFDAMRVDYRGISNLRVDLIYARSVRTIWGVDGGKFGATHRPAHIGGDNLFANISYKSDFGTLTGFAYLVEQDEAVIALRRNSSQTYGARLVGAVPLSRAVKLAYLGSYARQGNYAGNPVRYRADYAAAELALEWEGEGQGLRLAAGYELLGSDKQATGIAGGYAFQTPYATLHKFNGWADKFLTTPATGLQDHYAALSYTLKMPGGMGPLTASLVAHRFDSDRLNIHYGEEYDAQLSLKINENLNALIKYADYRHKAGANYAGGADTRKFWTEIGYVF